ncbi:MAG: hypothetical protein Q7T20_19685 [Saprospiraceae bacterium]|nr:hypothetical protein [Saprospiraceae bacterium]
MRIIGSIEHPSLKISVFKNDGRTSVKFETSLYEQTFKMGDDERFNTLEGVQKIVDDPMIEKIMEGFRQMHSTRLEAMARNYPVQAGEIFEEII